jgi:DNA polymerase-3 subunit gamma/tau
MSQALYRKWRPHRWEQVIGQQHIVQTLRNAVVAERVAHAYLFAGPRGTGKTTTARLLAKAVNCLDADLANRPCDQCVPCQAVNQGRFLDLIEIDAASNTSVEDVRDLRDKINFSPNQGRYKVYIVDEVHMLSTAAFNALLKTLEEPPSHAIFILATTEIHKIPATVLSRCQRHEFRRIPVNDIVTQLRVMAEAEGLQVADDALSLVARQSTGSLRDAISLIDQLGSSGKVITLELAQTVLGTAGSQAVVDIVGAILAGEMSAGLDQLHRTLDAGSDPRQFARQMVDYLRNLLLIKMGTADQVDATAEIRTHMARHAQHVDMSELLRMIRVFNQAAGEARSTWQPSLPLELALVESISVSQPEAGSAPKARQVSKTQAKKSAPSMLHQSNQEPGQSSSEAAENTTDEARSETTLLLKSMQEKWRQILSQVRRESRSTEALLNSGRLLGIKDGVLYFGIPSEVLKSKIEKSENVEVIQQALKDVLQIDLPFRCVVSGGKSGGLPPDIDGEGMVASALRDLGGEIVDVQ